MTIPLPDEHTQHAERLRELEALAAVSTALRSAQSREDVEALLIDQAFVLLGTYNAAFLRYEPTHELVCTACQGFYADDLGLRLKPGQGLSWHALTEGDVQVVSEAQSDPRVFLSSQSARGSILAAPLFTGENTAIGVITVVRRDGRPFDGGDVRIARMLTAVGSTAIERLQYVEELKATREGALLALGLALEVRDFETRGHTERVVRLAVDLGAAVGLSLEDLRALRDGAYLHDVGKLGVPDSVLLKPGKLDEQEWVLMQAHAQLGYELARQIPFLSAGALQVVRHHHEHWDGRGYPDGLAGEDIPMFARIFALCDVYDALVSERPYKRAWTHEEALREIAAQAGRQFDPQLTHAFLASFGQARRVS